MDLTGYIEELNYLSKNLKSIVNSIIISHQYEVIDILQIRLEEKGTDSKGYLIGGGEYAPATIFYKEQKGAITSHFTLFDTGGFYNGMFVEEKSNELNINSKDKKTSILEDDYGDDILGLNNSEENIVGNEIVDVELQKIINNLL